MDRQQRGDLLRVRGVSASSNLPKHIRMRQEKAALQALRSSSINGRIDVVDAPSKGQGTVVFVWAQFENSLAGFTSLGQRGKPAERVAEEACEGLFDFVQGSATFDRYLADQVLLPLAMAEGSSRFTTETVTQHLLTNAWVINQFFPGCVQVDGEAGQPGECWIQGTA
jgi:RNA 3'-terminal phosphate cyclase (ATP)